VPSSPPDLRFLHYNDVYHIEAGSQEPVGGYPRFQTLINYYKDDARFEGQPKALTFFSGDAFNPSIESSITKGKLKNCRPCITETLTAPDRPPYGSCTEHYRY
jgi:hypothetical protein